MTDIKHGKRITTQVFYEGVVTNEKQQYEVSLYTTPDMMLKEVIDALTLLKRGETSKLELCVQIDNKNRVRLVKTWQA